MKQTYAALGSSILATSDILHVQEPQRHPLKFCQGLIIIAWLYFSHLDFPHSCCIKNATDVPLCPTTTKIYWFIIKRLMLLCVLNYWYLSIYLALPSCTLLDLRVLGDGVEWGCGDSISKFFYLKAPLFMIDHCLSASTMGNCSPPAASAEEGLHFNEMGHWFEKWKPRATVGLSLRTLWAEEVSMLLHWCRIKISLFKV